MRNRGTAGTVRQADMVLNFYKLADQPFGLSPAPRYLFLGRTHREALASVLYSVAAGRGFTALIAKPGMGKTSLLFDLLNIVSDQAKTAFLFQSQRSPEDMLHNLLEDLELEHEGSDIASMQRKLNGFLLSLASKGQQLVVVIDEAQNLDEPVLEVVRMLSNFETPQEKLVQFVLAGQPQLAEKLASPSLLQLRQRISIIARLNPLTAEDTQQYIDHRLRVAGYDFQPPLFTKRAVGMIAEQSEGIPRTINNICFNAMSLGCVNKQKTIDTDVIQEVIGDLDLRPMFPEPANLSRLEETKEPVAAGSFPKRSQSPLRNRLMQFGLAVGLIAVSLSGFPAQTGEGPSNSVASTSSPAALPVKNAVATLVSDTVTENREPSLIPAAVEKHVQFPKFMVVQPKDTFYQIGVENFGLADPRRVRVGRRIELPATSASDDVRPVVGQAGRSIKGGH
jgi:general secretion pathway protein A